MPTAKKRGFPSSAIANVALGILASLVVSLTVTVLNTSHVTVSLIVLSVGIAIGFSALAASYLARALKATRYADLRVALTGPPKVGKTVLANIILDRLMSSVDEEVVFTADSATAISVYQAIRGMDHDEWPASTETANVYKYQGRLRVLGPRRDTIVNLEVGDSAGEHWIDLGKRKNSETDTRNSPYLEYVLSSNSVIHLTSADLLCGNSKLLDDRLDEDVQDLLIASQLSRSVVGTETRIAMLLVISKADYLFRQKDGTRRKGALSEFVYDSVVETRISSAQLLRSDMESIRGELRELSTFIADDYQICEGILKICQMAERMAGVFGEVPIMFASIYDRREGGGRITQRSSGGLIAWMVQTATRSGQESFLHESRTAAGR